VVRRAALSIGVLVLAGCGRGGDRAAVRSVTERFLTAYQEDRGGTACAALGEDTRAELVSQEGTACADAVGSLQLDGGMVTRVVLDVDGALVELSSGERAFVSRTTNGWRLTAVGCRPTDGPPDRYPMDCELTA
jgi:hypothetical protein